jgi:hypothetical protein
VAARLALSAIRLSGPGRADQPRPSGLARARRGTRAAARWRNRSRWSRAPTTTRCGSGEPAMKCGGVGQHKDGGSSPRPRDDGGAVDLARGDGGADGERSPVAVGDLKMTLQLR